MQHVPGDLGTSDRLRSNVHVMVEVLEAILGEVWHRAVLAYDARCSQPPSCLLDRAVEGDLSIRAWGCVDQAQTAQDRKHGHDADAPPQDSSKYIQVA